MSYTQDQFNTMRRVWRTTHDQLKDGSSIGKGPVRQLHTFVDTRLARYAMASPEEFLEKDENYRG